MQYSEYLDRWRIVLHIVVSTTQPLEYSSSTLDFTSMLPYVRSTSTVRMEW